MQTTHERELNSQLEFDDDEWGKSTYMHSVDPDRE